MRKRMLAVLALVAVMCLAGAPRADAHVGISIGIPFPGVYIGPPVYPTYYYRPAPVYYGPSYYGSAYYGPAYYDSYYGYGPAYGGGVVFSGRFGGHRHWRGGHWGHHWHR